MGYFVEHRIEREGNKEFDVIRVKRGRSWFFMWMIVFAMMILFAKTENAPLFALTIGLFVLLLIIGIFEGGRASFRAWIAPYWGYEYRIKGKAWSSKEPLETWVERKHS